MNLRNIAIYVSLMFLVIGLSLLFQNMIVEMQASNHVQFSAASLEYTTLFTGSVEINSFENITERSVAEYQEDPLVLTVNDSGSSAITDNLAPLNFFRSRLQKIMNPIRFIFNAPSFLLSILGLPLEAFSIITVLLNLAFYIGIITMVIRELK